jgi:hypothetical protein
MVDLLFSAPTEHYCLAFCAVINDLMSHKRYGKAKLLPANCGVERDWFAETIIVGHVSFIKPSFGF